jgi:hypothetical protein
VKPSANWVLGDRGPGGKCSGAFAHVATCGDVGAFAFHERRVMPRCNSARERTYVPTNRPQSALRDSLPLWLSELALCSDSSRRWTQLDQRGQSSTWKLRPEDRPIMSFRDLCEGGVEWPPRWDRKF